MLELESVSYRYAGALRPSLQEVSLQLGEGEVVGLIGPSEAGKTTLCLVAAGLAPRTIGGQVTGRLLVDGKDVAVEPMHAMAERVGISFENPATQLSGVAATVFEEVAFGPMNLALPRDQILDRTWSALDALRVGHLAARDPRRLSGGQQQLVAIAGLLALRPRQLILDEPTAQLDPEGTRLVANAVALLAADGASILIAEQKTDVLRALAGRCILLDAGRVALEGPTAHVLADARLAEAGVAWPPAVRLQRGAETAGLSPALRRRLAAALGPERSAP